MEDVAFALSRWRKTQYDFQHFGAAFATVECQLYAGRVELARARVLSEWKAMSGSLLFRKAQTPRILLFSMRGRTALAAWLRDRMNRKLLREVEHFARKLMNTGAPWAEAISLMLRAGVLAGRDEGGKALLLLERAEYILREQDLRLLAAAVMRRRGELEGDAGTERIQAADAIMRSENIVRPDRMTFMILPGAY
jgi:hypothetical protein